MKEALLLGQEVSDKRPAIGDGTGKSELALNRDLAWVPPVQCCCSHGGCGVEYERRCVVETYNGQSRLCDYIYPLHSVPQHA